MTVQLVEPFEWPVKPEDVDKSSFETERFWEQTLKQNEETKKISDINKEAIPKEHRKSIAEQAQEILAGKTKWGPTWENVATNTKVMKGISAPRKEEVLLPSIAKKDAAKGRTIRVF